MLQLLRTQGIFKAEILHFVTFWYMAAPFTKLLQNVIKCYCAKALHFFAGKVTFLLQNMLQKVSRMPLFVTICVIFFVTKCNIFAPSENYTLHHFVTNLHHEEVALCIIL